MRLKQFQCFISVSFRDVRRLSITTQEPRCSNETARCRVLSTPPLFHLEFRNDPLRADQCFFDIK